MIDGAENCTYSVFATTKERFRQLFPKPQDIEFSDDLFARLGKKRAKALLADLWKHPVDKPDVKGIHGTLFFQLEEKKQYYPTKREAEMVALGRSEACVRVPHGVREGSRGSPGR